MHFDPDPIFCCRIKEHGVFKDFINIYRRICNSLRNIKDPKEAFNEAKEIVYHIKQLDMKSNWDMIEKDYIKFSKLSTENALKNRIEIPAQHLIPAKGLSTNTITQILLTHGFHALHHDPVPFGIFLDMENIKPVEYKK